MSSLGAINVTSHFSDNSSNISSEALLHSQNEFYQHACLLDVIHMVNETMAVHKLWQAFPVFATFFFVCRHKLNSVEWEGGEWMWITLTVGGQNVIKKHFQAMDYI